MRHLLHTRRLATYHWDAIDTWIQPTTSIFPAAHHRATVQWYGSLYPPPSPWDVAMWKGTLSEWAFVWWFLFYAFLSLPAASAPHHACPCVLLQLFYRVGRQHPRLHPRDQLLNAQGQRRSRLHAFHWRGLDCPLLRSEARGYCGDQTLDLRVQVRIRASFVHGSYCVQILTFITRGTSISKQSQ